MSMYDNFCDVWIHSAWTYVHIVVVFLPPLLDGGGSGRWRPSRKPAFMAVNGWLYKKTKCTPTTNRNAAISLGALSFPKSIFVSVWVIFLDWTQFEVGLVAVDRQTQLLCISNTKDLKGQSADMVADIYPQPFQLTLCKEWTLSIVTTVFWDILSEIQTNFTWSIYYNIPLWYI